MRGMLDIKVVKKTDPIGFFYVNILTAVQQNDVCLYLCQYFR